MLLDLHFFNYKFVKVEMWMKRFLRFFEKITTFWACFVGSGLKTIFHCSAHPRILSRSSFSIFTVSSGSETIENKVVSLANNLTFDFRSAAKSFMYIRKKVVPWVQLLVYTPNQRFSNEDWLFESYN